MKGVIFRVGAQHMLVVLYQEILVTGINWPIQGCMGGGQQRRKAEGEE